MHGITKNKKKTCKQIVQKHKSLSKIHSNTMEMYKVEITVAIWRIWPSDINGINEYIYSANSFVTMPLHIQYYEYIQLDWKINPGTQIDCLTEKH